MKKLVFLVLLGLLVPSVSGQTSVEDAFNAIVVAEEAGGDVSGLIDELNAAIVLLEEGHLDDAQAIIDRVLIMADAARVRGSRETLNQGVVAVVVAGVFVGFAVLVWLRGDAWFWRFWGYTRRGFVVDKP